MPLPWTGLRTADADSGHTSSAAPASPVARGRSCGVAVRCRPPVTRAPLHSRGVAPRRRAGSSRGGGRRVEKGRILGGRAQRSYSSHIRVLFCTAKCTTKTELVCHVFFPS